MNTGIADAFNLAWKLVLFCRGRGGGALLDSYQRERRPVAEDMLRGVDALSRASLVRARALRGARDSLLRLAGGRPQLARRLVRRASQLTCITVIPLGGGRAGCGDRPPAPGPLPGDRVPDAALVSLRDGGRGGCRDCCASRCIIFCCSWTRRRITVPGDPARPAVAAAG